MESKYVYGSGQIGCLYDYGPEFADTREDGVEALALVLELTEEEQEELRDNGIVYFTGERRHEVCADYAECGPAVD